MPKELVIVNDVSKNIKNKQILKPIHLRLFPGEVVGLIGPNGAGKTSLLRLMTGLSSLSSGKITIDGHDVTKELKKALTGVGSMIENPAFYPHLTGLENLKLFANMLTPKVSKQELIKLAETVDLQNALQQKVKHYSLGMRQRLGICLALAGNPKLLLLDEPMNGLDPNGILEVKKWIDQLATQGVAVLISSHQLSDLEMMCSRFIMIENGKLKKEFTLNELSFENSDTPIEFLISTSNNEKAMTFIHHNKATYKEDHFTVTITIKELNKLLAEWLNHDLFIYQIKNTEGNLEHLFQKYTGGLTNDASNKE